MTRFNELRRIQAAIEHRNVPELRWALDYCQVRLRIATLKLHMETWRQRAERIRAALAQIEHHDQ